MKKIFVMKFMTRGLAFWIPFAVFIFQYIGLSLSVMSQNLIGPGTTFKVAPGTTVTSGENLVVKNGALLTNSGTLVLKKGLTNEYAVPNSLGSGLAEFSGTSNQSILGQNILQDMKVANSAGITIGGNTTVNGALNFVNGRIALGSNNLQLGPSALVTGSISVTAMIVATGTGELRKEFITGFTGSFTWPVGDATATAEYTPVTLTFTGGTFAAGNYIGVKLVNAKYPDPAITGNYLNRYWTLTQNGITNPQYNAIFQYVPADIVGNESQINCLRVDPPPTVTYNPANTNLHQLTASSVTAVGTFTGGQATVTCTLSVTPANQNVLSLAGSTSFSITSNCSWTAISSQTWCTITPTGSGNGTIIANYAANTLPIPRTATITVTVSGAAPVQVTVTQEAALCTLAVTPSNQNVPASPAGSTTFAVTSNCPWTAISSQTWCTVTPSGSGNGTIIANYAINTSTSPRTATITVNVSGLNPVLVTVTQAAMPCMLSVTPSNQNVAATPAGSTTFNVTTNCDWTASSNQTWCTVTPSGSGNGTINANYAVNTTTTPRTATITVTVPGANPVLATVTQEAASPCSPPWQAVQNQQYSMNVVANLYISNVLTTNANDALGAFVGLECRGIAYPVPAMNGLIFLTITSNVASGETVTFKAWNSATCEECPIAETLPFIDQSEIGTIANPFAFHCGSVQLCINFGAGYTWFSVNVDPGSMTLNTLFDNLNACENDRIIGQQTFATYYGNQWVGSLTAISPTAMYKLKLCTSQTWCKVGTPVPIVPISIGSGYPWIGYLPQSDLPINTALTGIVPAPVLNDRFNAQTSFAVNNGSQWVGSLPTLQKGKGYVIHLANPSTLTYPTGFDNQVPVEPGETPAMAFSPTGDYPRVNPQYNMQVIAAITKAGKVLPTDPEDVVYVYCGNECRGMAGPVPGLDGKIFLTVGSDIESGDKLVFKVFLAQENTLYEVKSTLEFSSQFETGTMEAPYELDLAGANAVPIIQAGNDELQIGEIYPNPFDALSSLDITVVRPCHISAVILDNLGVIKGMSMDDEMNPGKYTLNLDAKNLIPGMYTFRITYTDEYTRRIFAKKMIVW